MRNIESIKCFKTPELLANSLAFEFKKVALEYLLSNRKFNIAISGGNTPNTFYQTLASSKNVESIPWYIIHLFWVDERCVPPDDNESNYKLAKEVLLDRIDIPKENIHRIHGEKSPDIEVVQYSEEVLEHFRNQYLNIPRFDWVFLGLGEDGHIASIFPYSATLASKYSLFHHTINPYTNQNRISMSIPIINQSKRITFIITGGNKADILRRIIKLSQRSKKYPVTYISPQMGCVDWYIDINAGKYLYPEK
ncbi:6-phosphogluconolactonase [Candidatus Neomarinimicrobiota bacterium]